MPACLHLLTVAFLLLFNAANTESSEQSIKRRKKLRASQFFLRSIYYDDTQQHYSRSWFGIGIEVASQRI